jgi:hypothetical protein
LQIVKSGPRFGNSAWRTGGIAVARPQSQGGSVRLVIFLGLDLLLLLHHRLAIARAHQLVIVEVA